MIVSEYEGLEQKSFISEIEWVPFRSLLWKTNDSIASVTISFTSGVSLWDQEMRQTLLLKYVNSWQQ